MLVYYNYIWYFKTMFDYRFPNFLKCKAQSKLYLFLLKWQSKDTNRIICRVFTLLNVLYYYLNSFTNSLQSISLKIVRNSDSPTVHRDYPCISALRLLQYLLDCPFKATCLSLCSRPHTHPLFSKGVYL